jgi:CBS domain containing-hemolysin-like protein
VIYALIIAALIVLNGLFVAAEFAIIGVPRASVDRRAARGDRLARMVRSILDDPRRQDEYIATAQIGITLASLGLGMFGEHVLAVWFALQFETLGVGRWIAAHAAASAVAVGVLTYFHIVLGEMVPKSLALLHAERVALWVTPLMRWIKAAVYPLAVGLNVLGNGILLLFGVRRTTEAHVHTSEELELIVRESEEGGLLTEQTADVVHDLVEFGERTAGEVMTPRVAMVGIPLNAPADAVATIIRSAPHTRYPVYQGDLDYVLGVVHMKDVLRRLWRGEPLQFHSPRPMPFLPETATLDAVLTAMSQYRVQMAVVIDEYGGTAGMVTIEDLFEEIIGEVEEGTALPAISRDESGRLRVSGTTRLEEVGEELDLVVAHDEVDTVSGLVLTLLSRPPQVGDRVEYGGLIFEVARVAGRGVRECIVFKSRG